MHYFKKQNNQYMKHSEFVHYINGLNQFSLTNTGF